MSIEKNKQVVSEFFQNFSAANIDAALNLLDDNATWRVMGTKGELPISGVMNKEGIGSLIKMVKEAMPEGLKLTANGWTIQDNRVAVEIESYGKIEASQKVYNNFYHFLIELKEEKIISVKEYMDTLHVKEIFIDN